MSDRYTVEDAMDAAKEAQRKIMAHEDICAIRYNQIAENMATGNRAAEKNEALLLGLQTSISDSISGVYTRLWIFAGAMGGCMFAIIMLLVARVLQS